MEHQSEPEFSPLMRKVLALLARIEATGAWDGLCRNSYLEFFLNNADKLSHARQAYYAHDPQSLAVFDWRVTYLTLCSFFYWEALPFTLENTPFTAEDWRRLKMQASQFQSPISGAYPLDIIDTWILESYRLPGICEARKGDVVLDCGAYTGSTSLYFSRIVGAEGHVYGFEASAGTFAQYSRNMAGCGNVSVIHGAVAGSDGKVRFSTDNIPGSHIEASGQEVDAYGIDAFVRRRQLARVDFIKMDIEGAEQDALRGARDTIARFRPRMALSIYHRPDDLFRMPKLVLDAAPDYAFYLRHFCDREWETVLYCEPGGKNRVAPPAPEAAGEHFDLVAALRALTRGVEALTLRKWHDRTVANSPFHVRLQQKYLALSNDFTDLLQNSQKTKKELIAVRKAHVAALEENLRLKQQLGELKSMRKANELLARRLAALTSQGD